MNTKREFEKWTQKEIKQYVHQGGKSKERFVIDKDKKLYLCVQKSGSKSYEIRVNENGAWRWKQVGRHPEDTLMDIKDRLNDFRLNLRKPKPPAKVITLEIALDDFLDASSGYWNDPKRASKQSTAEEYRATFNHYILYGIRDTTKRSERDAKGLYPIKEGFEDVQGLAGIPIQEISTVHLKPILKAVLSFYPSVVSKMIPMLHAVFAQGMNLYVNANRDTVPAYVASYNPASSTDVDVMLGKGWRESLNASRTSYRMPYPDEIFKCAESFRKPMPGQRFTEGGDDLLFFCALTLVRAGAVCFARWDEIDWDGQIWWATTKKKTYPVPLVSSIMEILTRKYKSRSSEYIWESSKSKSGAISENTLGNRIAHHHFDWVPHGLRSSFRTWGQLVFEGCEDALEFQLGHLSGAKGAAKGVTNRTQSAVKRVYARSTLLKKRREILEAWEKIVVHGQPCGIDRDEFFETAVLLDVD